MPYHTTKYCVLALLSLYCVAGFYSQNLPGGEYYPFFSWVLFDRIPENPKRDYTIRILHYAGRNILPPALFKDAGAMFSSINNSPPAYHFIIRNLASAIEAGDSMRINSERQRLERNFLEHPVHYEVLRIRYDPIAFWKRGELAASERLAVFESRPPQP